MEDFNKRLTDLKTSVINEIKEILPAGKEHTYKEQFYCTIIDGELSPVSLAMRIKNDGGKIVLHDLYEANAEEYDTELSSYEVGTIIYAYETLHKELRAEKIERIKELVAKAGGKVEIGCEFTFSFRHKVDGRWTESGLKCVEIGNNDVNGKTVDALWFDCYRDGKDYEQSDEQFPDEGLDSLIAFIEQKVGEFDISLTDEQKEAVEQFETAFTNLKVKGVKIFYDNDTRLHHFCNGVGFDFDVDFDNQRPKGFVSVQEQLDKLPTLSIQDDGFYSDNGDEIIAKRI